MGKNRKTLYKKYKLVSNGTEYDMTMRGDAPVKAHLIRHKESVSIYKDPLIAGRRIRKEPAFRIPKAGKAGLSVLLAGCFLAIMLSVLIRVDVVHIPAGLPMPEIEIMH